MNRAANSSTTTSCCDKRTTTNRNITYTSRYAVAIAIIRVMMLVYDKLIATQVLEHYKHSHYSEKHYKHML